MAINPELQFTGKIDPSSTEYPFGKARNISTPGDGTGTPWIANLVNDIFGYQQSVLSEAGITPSNSPEEVGASQYLQAQRLISVSSVATVAAMKAKEQVLINMMFSTREFATGGGGAAFYRSIVTGVTPGVDLPDEALIFVSTDNPLISYFLVHNGAVTVRQLGSTGDGVADDFIPLNAGLQSPAVSELLGSLGDTYRSADTLPMQAGTELNLRGSVLSFDIIGKKRCLVTNDFCNVKNGTVENVTSDITNHGDSYQQPIAIGFGDSILEADTPHDVICENLTITSVSPGSNGMFIFGACYNILIQNIDIPDSAFIELPIGAHWSVEPGGDETQGTGHGNNLRYNNIRIGDMSFAGGIGTAACFFSAVRTVELENIFCDDYQAGSYVFIFAGDHGFKYSLDPMARTDGTIFDANNLHGVSRKGINVVMKDTLEEEIVWPSRITFERASLTARVTSDVAGRGIDIAGTSHFEAKNCYFNRYFNGMFLNGSVTNLLIENCEINDCFESGINADNSPDCANIRFIKNEFKDNNSDGGTGYDMIFGSFMDNITLDGNTYNSALVTNNVNMVAAAPPRNVKVINNHVETNPTGGTIFVFGSASSFGICELFSGNTFGETVTKNIRTGQVFIPYALTSATNSPLPIKRYVGTGTSAPSFGTYNEGDIVEFEDIVAAGNIGTACETSGTQGTYAEGRTATTDGSPTVILDTASDVLRKGDYLIINGDSERVISISGTTMVMSGNITAGGPGLAIAYTVAVFKTYGPIAA